MRISLAAAAAAAAFVCAPATAAPVPQGFYGVAVSGPVLDGTVSLDRELRRIQASGADQITATLNWVDVEPNGPPEAVPADWSRFDKLVAAAARRRLRVLPVVVQAPAWARTDPARPFSPPADPATFGAFVGRAAQRYAKGGAFWTAHPSLPRLVLRDWQLWNEPSGGNGVDDPSIFWQKEGPWAGDYVALLKAGDDALHAVDPSAHTLLGGLVGRSWEALDLLYDSGARGHFDRVAVHPYTGDPHRVDEILQLDRKALKDHGDKAVPLTVTEMGWPSFNSSDYKKLGRKKIARYQGRWAQTALAELTQQRRALRLTSLFWFTWLTRDSAADDAFDYAGLTRLTPGGKVEAKPSLKAFRRWALKARRARR